MPNPVITPAERLRAELSPSAAVHAFVPCSAILRIIRCGRPSRVTPRCRRLRSPGPTATLNFAGSTMPNSTGDGLRLRRH
jgi:hypothetical protein